MGTRTEHDVEDEFMEDGAEEECRCGCCELGEFQGANDLQIEMV